MPAIAFGEAVTPIQLPEATYRRPARPLRTHGQASADVMRDSVAIGVSRVGEGTLGTISPKLASKRADDARSARARSLAASPASLSLRPSLPAAELSTSSALADAKSAYP